MPSVDWYFRWQFAVIIRDQAFAAGMTRRQIDRKLQSRIWLPLRRSAYRLAAVPLSWQAELMAVILLTNSAATHRSGVRVHGLDGSFACDPEVTVHHLAQRPMAGAIVHGSKQMHLFSPIRVNGIPVTPAARTLLDVAAEVKPHKLTQMVDDALRRRLTSMPSLWGTLIRHAVQGRNGIVDFRAELERRDTEEEIPLSMWSRWVARLLVDAGLPGPSFEYRIERNRGFVAQVDLAFPRWSVALELDSKSFHAKLESFHLDPLRRNRIRNSGWHLLEVTWELYVDQPSVLIDLVRDALEQGGWRRNITA
ncbi:MAG: hypothetical protein GY929_09560 [Actinomycetia bacterium]|nr:hypothetical protein [Actinomycetes bacterium]